MKKRIDLMKLLSVITLIMLPLIFASCDPTETKDDNRLYKYYARTAKHVWADNIQPIDQGRYTSIETDGSIPLNLYTLHLQTCNVGYDAINLEPAEYNGVDFKPYDWRLYNHLTGKYADNGDPMIEAQLDLHYKGKSSTLRSNEAPAMVYTPVDYRTTPMKSLSITFSEDFLGLTPGTSLNHLFNLDLRGDFTGVRFFLITNSKKVIWPNDEQITLRRFLDFSPMVPVELFMQFNKSVKVTEPITGKFTISIETETGTVISSTTRSVTLTP